MTDRFNARGARQPETYAIGAPFSRPAGAYVSYDVTQAWNEWERLWRLFKVFDDAAWCGRALHVQAAVWYARQMVLARRVFNEMSNALEVRMHDEARARADARAACPQRRGKFDT